jgi:hypothetical protein
LTAKSINTSCPILPDIIIIARSRDVQPPVS